MKPKMKLASLTLLTLLSSCARQDYMRTESVTDGVGNALAANTTLQLVDPWPAGVENPNIIVPAVRNAAGVAAATPAPASAPTQ